MMTLLAQTACGKSHAMGFTGKVINCDTPKWFDEANFLVIRDQSVMIYKFYFVVLCLNHYFGIIIMGLNFTIQTKL